MAKDFSTDRVFRDNLARLSEKECRVSEARVCEIAELARQAAVFALSAQEDGLDPYEIFAVISDALDFPELPKPEDALPGALPFLSSATRLSSAIDRAAFAGIFTELAASLFESECVFLPEIPGDNSVAYVKNAFSEEAFEVFAEELPDSTVRYVGSIREAIASVLDGETRFCLLPLEERGVRIQTVEDLLHRNELRIASLTPVFGFDGLADMKYALVSRSFLVPVVYEGDDRYLEITVAADDPVSLPELLTAANALGEELYRVHTAKFADGETDAYYTSLIFRRQMGDHRAFLSFLTLFVTSYTPIGIYKNLE